MLKIKNFEQSLLERAANTVQHFGEKPQRLGLWGRSEQYGDNRRDGDHSGNVEYQSASEAGIASFFVDFAIGASRRFDQEERQWPQQAGVKKQYYIGSVHQIRQVGY